ncbi:MAG: redoxin domain-containing protein [Hymenobacteraceae bacterium]|nr:redoxin domain-containing protein [Hymenobacteraceae bacterium]
MKKHLIVFSLLILGFVAAGTLRASAQSGYALGAAVPSFTLKSADGKAVSLADYASAKAVVVVFTNPYCPYTKLYEARLAALAKAGEALNVRYVFVNPMPDEKPTNAQQVAATGSGDGLAGLLMYPDDKQALTKAFGATKTPEAFILQPVGGKFMLRYKGAIDDNPQVEGDVREAYLRLALDAVAAGKSLSTADRRAPGCLIKTF